MTHLLAEASLGFQIVGAIFGIVVATGLFVGIQYRASFRWSRLAEAYGTAKPLNSGVTRRMQSGFLLGGGPAFQSYKGVLDVTVNDHGVGISVTPPFHLFYFCRPLFIPHDEISTAPTSWHWNANSSKLTMRRVPEIELVVDQSLATWIQDVHRARPELALDPNVLAGN